MEGQHGGSVNLAHSNIYCSLVLSVYSLVNKALHFLVCNVWKTACSSDITLQLLYHAVTRTDRLTFQSLLLEASRVVPRCAANLKNNRITAELWCSVHLLHKMALNEVSSSVQLQI